MNSNIRMMNYKEFKKYCEDRTCDGQWRSMIEALVCLNINNRLRDVQAKGFFFKKRRTEELREMEWEKIKILF